MTRETITAVHVNICILCEDPARRTEAEDYAELCGLSVREQATDEEFALMFAASDVRLQSLRKAQGDILVDFVAGSAAHRRKFGGGKGQMIAKAVGLKTGVTPHVYDLTAGLGGDAFVLASLGCTVTMVERNPVVHALLADGLRRAQVFAREQDAELLAIIERMELVRADAVSWLQQVRTPLPVIYLDPMFPERKKKSASVKKEMQAFHQVVGDDADAGDLLNFALEKAEFRVVVKRPRLAPSIDERAPSLKLEGKSSRYDIYALKALTKAH